MKLQTLLALFAATSAAFETSAAIRPGVYDELMLGYAPASRTLTGYFRSSTGGGQFNCIFYLRGRGDGAEARIETWFPKTSADRIGGTLREDAGGGVTVRLDQEPGGCAMVNPFADKSQPASFELAAARNWTQIRVVRAEKSYFYEAPGAATHRKGYLVQGDGIGVKAVAKDWLQVDYPGPDRTISGWIREADLYPAQ